METAAATEMMMIQSCLERVASNIATEKDLYNSINVYCQTPPRLK